MGIVPQSEWRVGTDLRENGVYRWGGREYNSVTSILDGTDVSSGLPYVAADSVAKCAAGLYVPITTGEMAYRRAEDWDPETASMIWTMQPINPVELLDYAYLKGAYNRDRQRWADRGTLAHKLPEAYARGERLAYEDVRLWVENGIPEYRLTCSVEEALPYCESLVKWLDIVQPTIHYSEIPVFHDQLSYAGTLDMIIEVDGRLYLADIKTSDSTKESHQLQLAAYFYAEFFALPDRVRRARWCTVRNSLHGAMVILVQPGGVTVRECADLPAAWNKFSNRLRVWRDHANGMRGVFRTRKELSFRNE